MFVTIDPEALGKVIGGAAMEDPEPTPRPQEPRFPSDPPRPEPPHCPAPNFQ